MAQDHERRASATLKDTLTFKKEIPLYWIIGFFCGGFLHLGVLIWYASGLVHRVEQTEKSLDDLKIFNQQMTTLSRALSESMIIANEVNKNQSKEIIENTQHIRELEIRLMTSGRITR